MNKIAEELRDWITGLLGIVPERIGRLLRRLYYRGALAASGKRLSVGRNVEIVCPGNIRLGDEAYLVDGAILRARGNARLTIGNRFAANGNARIVADNGEEIMIGTCVMVGPNAVIRASNHRTDDTGRPMLDQGQTGGRIVIGDDAWIGVNAVIVLNVTIGSHVIAAAGAVITRDVPDYAVVAGVPARVIADRRDRGSVTTARDASA
jgi:acetyltransferase-like isoleucine patch superfamily enzyme